MSPSLIDVVALVLQADPATLGDTSGQDTTPGWDSMQQVVLASVLEQTFGVTLTAEEIVSETSIGRLRATLARKGVG